MQEPNWKIKHEGGETLNDCSVLHEYTINVNDLAMKHLQKRLSLLQVHALIARQDEVFTILHGNANTDTVLP